jgi:hypothetical protein
MAQVVDREVAAIGIRLIDDAYMAWVAEAAESSRALSVWFDQIGPADNAYHAYLAALDREDAAARNLQRLSAVSEVCTAALTRPGQELNCEQAA